MAFPASHKTVFLLDHSSALFSQAAEEIEIESAKSSQSGFPPVNKISKSLWTSATESVLEYARIVWDIFPPASDDWNDHKLIRLALFNEKETTKFFPSWDRKHQTSSSLAGDLAKLAGRPPMTSNKFGGATKAKEKMRNGVRGALELLTEMSEAQIHVKNKDTSSLTNSGRIVCITHGEDLSTFVDDFMPILHRELIDVNSSAASSAQLSTISRLEVQVVCATSQKHLPLEEVKKKVSHSIDLTITRVTGGIELSKLFLEMALKHFDLASTTVTGIPMKEEQNASSSANYDVELFHKASAHWRLVTDSMENKSFDLSLWMPQTPKEGFRYNTITLKWCTPRGSSADLHNCTLLSRVSPTDVNSRPSSCLTNFLLSGRSVMLEMPRRSGTKILSHMLTSHGGEIFIHTLNISRSVLEEPPSISEGPGGRVTDYRVPDFGTIMKKNRMAPYFGEVKAKEVQPIENMRNRLARYTKSSPMVISATTIFNMEVLEPLQQIMTQERLSEENLAECRKIIYALLSMENRGEVLPVPVTVSSGGKGKGNKKDDQYKLMYAELEKFLGAHCRTEKHTKVLNCLLESRNRPIAEKRDEWDMASKDLERYNNMTEREKSDFNTETPSSKRNRSPSPGQSLAMKAPRKSGESLLDMWKKNHKENSKTHFTTPFVGMRSVGDKAKLYLSLERKDKEFNSGGST